MRKRNNFIVDRNSSVSRYIFKLITAIPGLLMLLASSTTNPLYAEAIKVEIINEDGDYTLYRDGKPYQINGAGYTEDDLSILKAHGGNAIRTWATYRPDGSSMMDFLDEAHSLGISVSLNLPVPAARWGDDYSDKEFTDKLMAKLKGEVMKFKDHPALLTWFIGNELDHAIEDFQIYNFVNDVAKMIKEVDPNHPTTTTLTGLNEVVLREVNARAPELDFVSFQVYGQIHNLPEFIKEQNYQKPIMITEWGAIGFWEMPSTAWQAPIEMDSTAKANNYYESYQKILAVDNIMIGNYVFLWGQKQERTPTWFGLFSDKGEKTEAIDVMTKMWTGEWPDNRSPQVKSFTLDGKKSNQGVILKSGESYSAIIESVDPDKDKLSYRWEVKPESDSSAKGGDFEEDIGNLYDSIGTRSGNTAEIIAPETAGAYRLFVYVTDGHNHVGHANIPFLVSAD